MCFASAKKPKPQPIPKEETRGDAAVKAANERRKRAANQNNADSNIATSPLGDPQYGNTAKKLVKLGA